MRTLEELRNLVHKAIDTHNAELMQSASDELDAHDTPEARALAAQTRGTAERLRGNYPESLTFYNTALDLYTEVGDTLGIAGIAGDIGIVYSETGQYDRALEEFHASLDAREKIGDEDGAARILGNIGNVHQDKGDYSTSLEYFKRSVAVLEELNDLTGVALANGNIGNVYSSVGEYPLALEYYDKVLAFFESVGDKVSVAISSANIGVVYNSTGDYPQSLAFRLRALKIFEELGDKAGIAYATENIGDVYYDTGDYEQADENFRRALALHEEVGDRSGAAGTRQRIGETLAKLDDPVGAEEWLRQSIEAATVVGAKKTQATATSSLIELLRNQGKQDAALDLLNSSRELTSQFTQANIRAIVAHARLAWDQQRYERANQLLSEALESAESRNERGEMAFILGLKRDLAKETKDYEAYIEHNERHLALSDAIRGSDATRKMSFHEKERQIEAHRLQLEKQKALLYGALPPTIADRMLEGDSVRADDYKSASVLFMDIVSFTKTASSLDAGDVVDLLELLFDRCDEIAARHGLTKIKTIGDAYMAVAGIPTPLEDHAFRAAAVALEFQAMISAIASELPAPIQEALKKRGGALQIRVGLHCGHVVAGVLGTQRLQYDVWGDSVNVASRMESTGEPGRIQASEAFVLALQSTTTSTSSIKTIERGTVDVKGKGAMSTYWLERG